VTFLSLPILSVPPRCWYTVIQTTPRVYADDRIVSLCRINVHGRDPCTLRFKFCIGTTRRVSEPEPGQRSCSTYAVDLSARLLFCHSEGDEGRRYSLYEYESQIPPPDRYRVMQTMTRIRQADAYANICIDVISRVASAEFDSSNTYVATAQIEFTIRTNDSSATD
jgi:hypothetical protein